MLYTLFNKRMNKCLIHPVYGLWCTEDIQEARKMLAACKKSGVTYGLKESDFVLIDVETKKVVEDE